ncbi:MAG: hypothetical protein ACE5IZ_09155, partial [Dehalococcoidia bacterium]
MMKENNHFHGGKLEEATAVATETGLSQDTFTAMVAQMVVQCGALLRQQMEHKAKQQPLLYDQERIDRIMAEFEAGSADIQDAIAGRVMSRLTHHVQQEVLRVLQDAMNDAAHSLEDPLWNNDEAWRLSGWVQKSERETQTAVEPTPAGPREPQPLVAQQAPPQPEPEPQVQEAPAPSAIAEVQPPAPSAIAEVQPPVPKLSELEEYGLPQQPPQGAMGEVYEGTVKLRVDATDSFRQV